MSDSVKMLMTGYSKLSEIEEKGGKQADETNGRGHDATQQKLKERVTWVSANGMEKE